MRLAASQRHDFSWSGSACPSQQSKVAMKHTWLRILASLLYCRTPGMPAPIPAYPSMPALQHLSCRGCVWAAVLSILPDVDTLGGHLTVWLQTSVQSSKLSSLRQAVQNCAGRQDCDHELCAGDDADRPLAGCRCDRRGCGQVSLQVCTLTQLQLTSAPFACESEAEPQPPAHQQMAVQLLPVDAGCGGPVRCCRGLYIYGPASFCVQRQWGNSFILQRVDLSACGRWVAGMAVCSSSY